MAHTRGESEGSGTPAGLFATTHWSVVLEAGKQDLPQAAEALEKLCRVYWFPLYAHIRHQGYGVDDSQELTQEFFARLLAKQWVSMANPERGRFRSFLLAAVNHFLANERDKARTLKRGGGQPIVSLECAEQRYQTVASDDIPADKAFDRQWALALLAQVIDRLRDDYHCSGRGPVFDALQIYLGGEKGRPTYRETGEQMNLSVDAVKKAVERLRKRYGEILRDEILHTVSDPAEVDEEIRHLRSVLGTA